MKHALPTIALLLLTGCEFAPLPSNKVTPPAPLPQPKSQVVELRITVDGEGKISLGGAGSVDVRSENTGAGCACGCSVPGCQCSGPNAMDLSRAAMGTKTVQSMANDAKSSGNSVRIHGDQKPQHIDIYTLANGRCQACEMLAADLQSRGISVRLVRDTNGQYSQYPTAVSEGRSPYQPPEGFNGTSTSNEVIRRLLK